MFAHENEFLVETVRSIDFQNHGQHFWIFEVKTSSGAPRHYSRAVNKFYRHASRHTLRGERIIRVSSGEPSLAERARNNQLCQCRAAGIALYVCKNDEDTTNIVNSQMDVVFRLSHLHPAARQFCRSTYTITDITIK
jgi:hypothetical protein